MKQLGILLTQHYRLLSLAATLDVFESVNKIYADNGMEPAFQINLISLTGDRFTGSDTLNEYHSIQVQQSGQQDLILIPAFKVGNLKQAIQENREFIPWLKKQFESGSEIGSFCTGAFLLGATGLLNGRIATTHVDACSEFAFSFPEVKLQPDKIVTGDDGIYTSGGATSSFHLMLHLLKDYCGKELAIKTAKLFAIDMDREQQSYFSSFIPPETHEDELVHKAQQTIKATYKEAGTIEEMFRDIPSSRRNIVRRFKHITGITPIEYLQKTRIEAAKRLLEQTNQLMTEVMINSGYNDPKAFRNIFKKTVGMTPTSYRKKFYN